MNFPVAIADLLRWSVMHGPTPRGHRHGPAPGMRDQGRGTGQKLKPVAEDEEGGGEEQGPGSGAWVVTRGAQCGGGGGTLHVAEREGEWEERAL